VFPLRPGARHRLRLLLILLALPVAAGPASAAGDPDVAALQVGLRARGLYAGAVDGVDGRLTERAVRALQRRANIAVDGVVGPRTRAVLGRYGKPRLGTRVLRPGLRGWDVAALQFALAWHGFPCGPFDGVLGPRTTAALGRFQRWSGLPADTLAGPLTLAALRRSPSVSPIALSPPLPYAVGDGFGPRGDRFHPGVDVPAPPGAPVAAAGGGRIVYAGWHAGGYGLLVVVAQGGGVRTFYAHLSSVDVVLGASVRTGQRIGLVGSTGESTGPHLHFEVRLRGAAVDPLSALR
jgi:peptidoglycan hydrolase-like protein with peptidoglycan-binding domain